MTPYEYARRCAEPFLPPIYSRVRRRLLNETSKKNGTLSILDVGGRKSPYTIGIPGHITIIDLPRDTEIQHSLALGINTQIAKELQQRRSNIDNVIFGDMTCSDLPDASFDVVVSVEVLEHVTEDELFVSEVSRVLKKGGKFIMTTPNGDFVKNTNPDHKRHYKKEQLASLLSKYFSYSEVEYAIAGGRTRKLGLRSWSLKRPIQTLASAVGNVVNSIQSSRDGIATRSVGTHHLFAVGKK